MEPGSRLHGARIGHRGGQSPQPCRARGARLRGGGDARRFPEAALEDSTPSLFVYGMLRLRSIEKTVMRHRRSFMKCHRASLAVALLGLLLWMVSPASARADKVDDYVQAQMRE